MIRRAAIVCGSRNWTDREAVFQTLDRYRLHLVIHGEAEGADKLAAEWCDERDVNVVAMPAQWKAHGKAAGPRRNSEMLHVLNCMRNCGWTPLVIGFPLGESCGTRHMISIASVAGIRTVVYRADYPTPELDP